MDDGAARREPWRVSDSRRLLLVGGGHAHLHALAAAGRLPQPVQVMLVDPSTHAIYSGMVPGAIAGHHAPEDCAIDLAAAARRAGATFIQARAVELDPRARRLSLADGRSLDYDLLSLDVGGAAVASTASMAAAGAAGSPAAPLRMPCRPFAPLLAALPAIDRRARDGGLQVAVIGAGLAGVEVALALAWRLRDCPAPRIRLLCSRDAPTPELPAPARAALARACARAGVELVLHARVRDDDPGPGLGLADGRRVAADVALRCTGAIAPGWLAGSGLALDAKGHVEVDTTLASLSHPQVYAAGDCASVRGHPRPRSGVLAVRQGPLLAANLARRLADRPARGRVPQRHALALVGLGPPRALAVRAGRAAGGPAGPGKPGGWLADTLAAVLWRWKILLDRRFVDRHR